MNKITRRDLDDAFSRLTTAVKAAGADPVGLYLQHGNQSAGRAYRIFRSDERGQGGLSDAFYGLDRGYLGWTMREAYAALDFLTQGIYFGIGERPS